METKSLLFGIGGLLLGGLIVSVAAATLNKPIEQQSSAHTSEMHNALDGKTGQEYDKEFLSHMIEHHEGAIETAKLSADRAMHDEIKKLSQDMIAAQQKEVDQMKEWQVQWGYSGDAHSHSHEHGH